MPSHYQNKNNGPRKFTFPTNESIDTNNSTSSYANVNLKSSFQRRRDQVNININDQNSQNQYNNNQISNNNNRDHFENIHNQFLHMSMDSDKMGKLGIGYSKKSLPFGQIETDKSGKHRNCAGSPPPVFSNKSISSRERNRDHYGSIIIDDH